MSRSAAQVRISQRRGAAARPPLRVVRTKKNRRLAQERGSSKAPLIVGAVVVIALIFGVLLEQVVMAQSAFKLSKQRERLSVAQEEHEQLLQDIARLDSPARIQKVAENRLHMIRPDVAQIEYISADIRGPGARTNGSLGGMASAGEVEVPASGTALGDEAP